MHSFLSETGSLRHNESLRHGIFHIQHPVSTPTSGNFALQGRYVLCNFKLEAFFQGSFRVIHALATATIARHTPT